MARTRVGSKSTVKVGVCVAEVFLVDVAFEAEVEAEVEAAELLSEGGDAFPDLSSGGSDRVRLRFPCAAVVT